MRNETIKVDVAADTTHFDTAMENLTEATRSFGSVFSSTISRSIQQGKSFESTLQAIARRFSDMALKQALKPVDRLFGNFLENTIGSLTTAGAGAASSALPFVPFAKGGVVSGPTAFSFGEKLGVMGEAGAEAIMPLARGPDGRLGVSGGSSAGRSVNVVFNVTTSDAPSFRKSEGQVTAMLARAVARGQRGL